MDKKPNSKNQFLNVVLWCLLLGFVAVFAFSSMKLLGIRRIYQTGTDTYAAIAESAVVQVTKPDKEKIPVPDTDSESTSIPEPVVDIISDEVPEQEQETAVYISVDFEKLRQINTDIEAWISNGEEINYPVVHGKDNEYYLNHLFDGTENENGAIFTDIHNMPGFVDRNTFVYGHNMKNGAMFANLTKYGTEGYYEQHPTLELITPDASYVLEVFSGYVTKKNSDAFQLRFADDESYNSYLKLIQGRSDFESDVEMSVSDKMVTLSTCADYSDTRYVLHCKLVKK